MPATPATPAAPSKPTRPNIIFILCDDLGWRDLYCYGSTFHETPHLDRLAAQGMRFTDAYASCPVCSPTRASAITGKYPATVGITQYIGGHDVGALLDVPYVERLPESEYPLPLALREHGGYQAWHVGKWHLGGWNEWPERRGFEVNIGGCDWGMPYRGHFSPWGIPGLPDAPEGTYLDNHLTDAAVRLIEQRDPARPFFLNFWPYAVHTPIQAPAPLVEKYRRKAAALGLDQQPAFVRGERLPILSRRDRFVERRVIQSDPTYAAMVEQLDTNVGRLLAALDAAGIADDTLFVFTSDNGGLATAEGSPTCNAPLSEGKGWMQDGGVREPLLVRWPGVVPAGAVSHALTTTPDFYPTFLEAADLPPLPTQHVDGMSILPALRGQAFERGPIYWHFPHYGNQGGRPGSSIRDGDWKLIEMFEDGSLQLYNLREDLSETRNLAATEPAIRDRLHAQLRAWRESVRALIPRPNPHWPDDPRRPLVVTSP